MVASITQGHGAAFDPSFCHSFFPVPPLDETVCLCKEFIYHYQASKENYASFKFVDDPVGFYMMCSQPAILNKLTAHEKRLFESISEQT